MPIGIDADTIPRIIADFTCKIQKVEDLLKVV